MYRERPERDWFGVHATVRAPWVQRSRCSVSMGLFGAAPTLYRLAISAGEGLGQVLLAPLGGSLTMSSPRQSSTLETAWRCRLSVLAECMTGSDCMLST